MKKHCFTLLFLCFCANTFAHDFSVNYSNGTANKMIYYRITSTEAKTVAVSFRGDSMTHYSNEYTQYNIIPATVNYGSGVNLITYQVTSVDAGAFLNNTTLDSVLLPNSITFIDSMAFSGSSLKKIVLPSNINFIAAKAFDGCSSLREIALPENITKISNYTFRNCRSLTSLTIPNTINSIGNYAFFNCISLKSVNLSGAIGDYAFNNCIALDTINLSSSVTKVGSFAFLGCFGLTAFNVDSGNPILMSEDGILYSYLQDTLLLYPPKKIGSEFTIPSSVKHVGDYSFSYNLFLKKINFSSSITKIGTAAFYNSTGLSVVNMLDSVNYIDEGAFYDCRNLDTIKISVETPPVFEEFTFYNVPNSVYILVPCEIVQNYENSEWGDYFTNIKGIGCVSSGISNVMALEDVEIFPNPVQNDLFININENIERVEVYSLTGFLMISESNVSDKISMENLSKGVYFVKIFTKKSSITKKIIKN